MKRFNKHLSSAIRCAAIFACALIQPAHSQDNKWETSAKSMMREKLTIDWLINSKKSKINLVGIENNQLLFNVPGQPGEASMPLDSLSEIYFADPPNSEYETSIGLIGNEAFNLQHLEAIRRKAYPRLRFVEIPRANSAFADTVRNLLDGLIQVGRYNEAIFVLEQLDVGKLGPDFEKEAIRLALILSNSEQQNAALKVIQRVPIERVDVSNLDFIIELAHALREQENYKTAQSIYKQIAANPENFSEEAKYWTYYCSLKQGQHIEDHTFAFNIATIKAGEETFPLQQLVLGNYYIQREQIKEAMRAISQGIAFARPTETWTPELMYRSGQIYKRYEMPEIAQSVFKETILFFPTTKWAEAAQTEIN